MRIYLDHAATTPVRPEVVKAMAAVYEGGPYNPSSLHAEGRRAKALLDDARDAVARELGAARKEIVFTGSGTEADNVAIVGVAHALRARGRHILSTSVEHHAVLHTLDALVAEDFEVTRLAVDEDGVVDPRAFAAALRPDTILASVMYANNEIGTIQPIAELARIAHERGVLIHTDAVQAPSYLPLSVDELGVDLLAIAAHKFYGPKGVGMLYVRTGTPIEPILHGGSQEFGLRPGTEDVAGIVGLATALHLSSREREASGARLRSLRDALEDGLRLRVPGTIGIARRGPRLPHIASVAFSGIDADALLMRLDLDGLAVSAGSACTSGILEPSHVIAALGVAPPLARGVIRFSLGRSTTPDEIERTLDIVSRAAASLRAPASV